MLRQFRASEIIERCRFQFWRTGGRRLTKTESHISCRDLETALEGFLSSVPFLPQQIIQVVELLSQTDHEVERVSLFCSTLNSMLRTQEVRKAFRNFIATIYSSTFDAPWTRISKTHKCIEGMIGRAHLPHSCSGRCR